MTTETTETRAARRTREIAQAAEAHAQAAEEWAEEQDIRARAIRKGTMRTKAAEARAMEWAEENGREGVLCPDPDQTLAQGYANLGGCNRGLAWANPIEYQSGMPNGGWRWQDVELSDEAILEARAWAVAHPNLAKQARDRANTEAREAAKEAKEARGRADRAAAHAERYQ